MSITLTLQGVSKSFGGLKAVDDVSFALGHSKIAALIGPNGAGKSTIINLITGIFAPTSGTINLDGEIISGLPTHRRSISGIARTYQTPQMVHGLTAFANVMAGAYRFGSFGVLRTILTPWSVAKENGLLGGRAATALQTVGIPGEWWHRLATDLPYGIQRRVEIARALAQEPKVLLLDEPAAGLNPTETAELGQLLTRIAESGISVLLVEHDMPLVMSIADHVVVINFGRHLAEGTPAEIAANPEVVAAYLGTDDEPTEWAVA